MTFIPILAISQGSWEILNVPTDQHLRSVYFTDSLYGWAVGDSGTIIHTQDGGNSWGIQDAGTNNNIVHVFFLDQQLGWASSWNFEGFFGTLILKTTDGGNTWSSQEYQEDNIFMNCILFLDPLNGWMGGSPHAIVNTTDGGQSWAQAAIDTNALAFFPVINIFFYDENYGYACGGMFDIAGVTWSTSNGGEKWYPIDNADAPADEVHGMHLYDSLNVLGAGGDPDQGYGVGMLRTDDGGYNWDYDELSMAGNAFDIDFRNKKEAWAPLGWSQQMIYSLDAGSTWTLTSTPESTAIFDMIFTDTLHGFAVGYDGAFIRYIPKPVGVEEMSLVSGVSLHVYPNPAGEDVSIRFFAVEGEGEHWRRGEISLYDTFGRIALIKVINSISKGENVFELNLRNLQAGMYIVKLRLYGDGNDHVSTQKLFLR